MAPTFANGKICYVEIPATDISRSAEFYRRAFGWSIEQHRDGAAAFNDTVGGVSGRWVLGRRPATEPGLMMSIMVADANAAVTAIGAAGGEIVRPVDQNAQEKVAWFRDLAGNVLGIYQQAGLAETEAMSTAADEPVASD